MQNRDPADTRPRIAKDKKRKAEGEPGANGNGMDITLNRVLGEPADPPPPAPPAPAPMSTKRYLEELAKLQVELAELQDWIHARARRS